uniref:AB hydrolase-1 domain-containing protein n=1 Tax=Rhodosorus marinus TaxID=101924 RepID=A0A7S0G8I6_9RHOD|mmetsp:Transcript_843/g.1267  ORF Transcript_843/g.1267 Transcript_843/m.1267 type:complete len:287 (+) Transcript_843:93-953(+)
MGMDSLDGGRFRMAGFATWSAVAQGPKRSTAQQNTQRKVEKRKMTWDLGKGDEASQKAEKKLEKRGERVQTSATRGWRRHPGLKVKPVPGLNGVYLHYHTARGSGNTSSAPPVLFIPHGPHAPWMFEEKLLPYFARRGFSAYTFDRHGAEYGQEQRSFNLNELCEEVEEVAKSLPRPPVIVGHSTGGFIAQALIQRQKIDPPAMVLLCPVPPSGSISLMMRHFLRSPWEGFRRLQAVLVGTAYDSATAMREAFFTVSFDCTSSKLWAKYSSFESLIQRLVARYRRN